MLYESADRRISESVLYGNRVVSAVAKMRRATYILIRRN